MDSDGGNNKEEEKPFCKVCGEEEGLMTTQVCDCTGSVAHVCLDCLRQTIARTCLPGKGHVDAESGAPLCPDCHAPYRNIQLDYVVPYEDFLDYTARVHGWTRSGALTMIGIPTLVLIGMLAGYFPLWNLWESQRPDDRILRGFATCIYFIVDFILGCFIFGGLVDFYNMIDSYGRRRPTELRILQSSSPRWDSRRSINQDAVIDMNVIPLIENTFREVFKTIIPDTEIEEFENGPHAPLPVPVRPQPPIAPHIPHARPQPQLGPILSRRGRRWSRPQQPRQPQPSSRQRQIQTPRRNLQQQPRSRNQGRRQ